MAHDTGWTDRRIAIVRLHWCNGKSASEIGDMIGLSRSAVISKAHRLGLAGPPPATTRAGRLKTRKRKRANLQAAQSRHLAGASTANRVGHSGGITTGFQAPAPRRCQWIEGEPRDRDFCGEPARLGSSYCDEHHARCWIAPPKRVKAKQSTNQQRGRLSLAIPT